VGCAYQYGTYPVGYALILSHCFGVLQPTGMYTGILSLQPWIMGQG